MINLPVNTAKFTRAESGFKQRQNQDLSRGRIDRFSQV